MTSTIAKSCIVAVFTLLISITAVFAAEWSSVQDGFRINATDIVCTGTECWVETRVCNLEDVKSPYNVSLFVDTLQPFLMLEWDEQQTVESVLVHDDVNYTASNGSVETDHSDDHYINQTKTSYAWVPAKNFLLKKDQLNRNQAESANLNFGNDECKDFRIGLHNVIGGVWKYDVNFLDPLINSTQYEVGNLTNSSNVWSVDANGSTTIAYTTSANRSFTMGLDGGVDSDNATAAYKFDADGDLTDYTGNANTLVLGNSSSEPTFISSGRIEGAYSFDGGDTMNSPHMSLSTTNGLTVGVWVYITDNGALHNYVISQAKVGAFGYNAPNIFITQTDRKVACGDEAGYRIGDAVPNGTWTHITCVFEPGASTLSHIHIYINGVESSAYTAAGTFNGVHGGAHTVRIGGHWNGVYYMNGYIDEPFFYRSNLSVDDIGIIYNAGAGRQYPYFDGFNVSQNTYYSKQIPLVEDVTEFTPVFEYSANGGSVSVNATCNADDFSPSWVLLSSGIETACGAQGNSFQYRVVLTGNTTHSPVVQNLTVAFSSTATEAEGREAILGGVLASSISGNYTAYEDQQVQIRLSNGTQAHARFDYLVIGGNKHYAFNYNESATTFTTFYNVTPVFYVWQEDGLSADSISSNVAALINGTY